MATKTGRRKFSWQIGNLHNLRLSHYKLLINYKEKSGNFAKEKSQRLKLHYLYYVKLASCDNWCDALKKIQ